MIRKVLKFVREMKLSKAAVLMRSCPRLFDLAAHALRDVFAVRGKQPEPLLAAVIMRETQLKIFEYLYGSYVGIRPAPPYTLPEMGGYSRNVHNLAVGMKWHDGATLDQIAEHLLRDSKTVQRWIKQVGDEVETLWMVEYLPGLLEKMP